VNEEQNRVLLMEVAERQKEMQVVLTGLVAAHAQALERYANSDAAYRKHLENSDLAYRMHLENSDVAYRKQLDAYEAQLEMYRKEQGAIPAGRKLAMAMRVIAVLLLLFIAYRVS
jgi:hypothetical protein